MHGSGGDLSTCLPAIRDALLVVRSDRPARVAALGIADDTGRAELAQVQAFDWTPHRLVSAETYGNFAEWQKSIGRMKDKADALILLKYDGLEAGVADHGELAGTEIVEWIETNAQPIPVGVSTSYVSDGGGLGISPSSLDFGQDAMMLALSWPSHPEPAPAPQIPTSSHFHVGIRPGKLATRGIELPAIYVQAARIGNAYYP